MLQSLALFLEKHMLVFVFLLIYFTIQHLEYIQDEVRHTVRVQQVSHFRLIDSLLASSSLKALRKQQSSFTERILCKYFNNCISMLLLRENRPSFPKTFQLLVLFSLLLFAYRVRDKIYLSCSSYFGLWSPPAFASIKFNWFNGCINKV